MGEKITDYSSISTTNPNKLSLIDVSELLGNSTYDTRSMSLEKLANYINPIPYPSMTIVLSGFVSQNFNILVVKNTIGFTQNPVVGMVTVTQAGFQVYTLSHPNFTTANCIITHSGTANLANSYTNFYNTSDAQISFRNFTDGVDNLNAMSQVVVTFYKTN
jgi:hypothetical protein